MYLISVSTLVQRVGVINRSVIKIHAPLKFTFYYNLDNNSKEKHNFELFLVLARNKTEQLFIVFK